MESLRRKIEPLKIEVQADLCNAAKAAGRL